MMQTSRQLPQIASVMFSRTTEPAVRSIPLFSGELPTISLSPAMASPAVVSAPILSPILTVQSFHFSDSATSRGHPPIRSLDHPPFPIRQSPLNDRRSATRIQPPRDVVKLADRLHVILQPSLETLIERAALDFPLQPFAYQLQGVAFLYPRFGAVLADEMGLGKTMQAITAVRMLLHAGEVKSVLLICPKPLITNWQREFGVWAPELPVTVIEGDPQRRDWQWRLNDAPVKIANYELLCRDAALVAEEELHFDLVLLDEAQRIKNRTSATSEAVCGISRRRSWALTGTPVENSPDDLVGIFEFVGPGQISSTMKPRALG
ncbi:MAG TPA: SNF2-related protein, partial [Pirellulales bacterium]